VSETAVELLERGAFVSERKLVTGATTPPATVSAPIHEKYLRDGDVGEFLGLSKSWVRRERLNDQRRARDGLPPLGPRWVVLRGKLIRYRLSDLLNWAQENSRQLGSIAFSNRGGAK
jgi:hypothetical protein